MKQRRVVTDRIEAAVIIGDNLVFEAHGHDEYVISANIIGDEKLQLNGKSYIACVIRCDPATHSKNIRPPLPILPGH